MTAPALNHYVAGHGYRTFRAACNRTIPLLPRPADDAPKCPDCLAALEGTAEAEREAEREADRRILWADAARTLAAQTALEARRSAGLARLRSR